MKFEFVQNLSRIIPWRVLVAAQKLRWCRLTGDAVFGRSLTARGLSEVSVAAGPGAGIRMKLQLENERYLWLGIHEPEVQEALIELSSEDTVAYDVGAYVGFFTLLLARACARVVAFEPNPESRKRLQENVELNRLDNCRIHPQAVADRVGEGLYHPSKNRSPLQGHLDDPEYPLSSRTPPVRPFPVPVTTLDHFVYGEGNPPPNLVKIDVEGGEVRVLRGMSRLLKEQQPRVICEVHNHALAEETAARLRRAGYIVRDLESGRSDLPAAEAFRRRRYLVAEPLPGESNRKGKTAAADSPEKLPRRVLLAASVGEGAIGGAFLRAFSSLGLEVRVVNNRDFLPLRISIFGRIVNRLRRKSALRAYNRELLKSARDFQPDWLVILKGTLLEPETLETVRLDLPRSKLVNVNYDDFFSGSPGNVFPDLRRIVPLFDIFFPSKAANVPELKQLGARKVIYLPIGYDPSIHHPVPLKPQEGVRFGSDLVFAGTRTPDRIRHLEALADKNLCIWGAYWKQGKTSRNLRRAIRNRGIYDADLARAFSASRIALNFFRPENRDTHNQRTFEIPACRCFMLSQRSEELESFFAEGREYAGFSSPEELAEKATYYLEHPDEREAVAERGYQRLIQGRHTIRDRVKTIIEHLEEP